MTVTAVKAMFPERETTICDSEQCNGDKEVIVEFVKDHEELNDKCNKSLTESPCLSLWG